MQDCTIAAECGCYVYLLMIADFAHTIRGVDGARKGSVDFLGHIGFEDKGDVWIAGLDVLGIFYQRIGDGGVVFLAYKEYIARWGGPAEGEEVMTACFWDVVVSY